MKKNLGWMFLMGAALAIVNAVMRWTPLVVVWSVETGEEIAFACGQAWDAFMTFQKTDPASAGFVSLVTGAAFAVIGYMLIHEKSTRKEEEPRAWENEPRGVDATFR